MFPPPAPPLDSSLFVLGPPLEPSPRYDLHDHSTIHPPDHRGFTSATLVEPATYQKAVAHQEWQHTMDEIAVLERTGSWELGPSSLAT